MNTKKYLIVALVLAQVGLPTTTAYSATGGNSTITNLTITVTVPSTTALTNRSNDWTTPADLKFTKGAGGNMPTLNGATNFPATDFASGNALVLLENPDVEMNVTASFGGEQVKLKVVRNPEDAPAIYAAPRTPLFSLVPVPPATGNPVINTGTMKATSRGSFYIVGWVDDATHGGTANDSVYQAGEIACALPIIVVNAEFDSESTAPDNTDIKYVSRPSAQYLVEALGANGGVTDGRIIQNGTGYNNAAPTVIFSAPSNGNYGRCSS